jgi:hypothetical protein
MPKRKCNFTDNLKAEFYFYKTILYYKTRKTDILPVEIETVVNKIFQYFHIYTIRVEELKKFCTFVDTEYKQVLRFVKIRWLSLEPADDRVIEMYEGLKSYFLSQDSCPTLLKNSF